VVAKHRRAAAAPSSPRPLPAREILVWTAFGCALVPLTLLWSGAGWAVALGVGGLIVLLAIGCALVLRLSGMTLTPVEPPPSDGHRDVDRPIDPSTGP
jgi:uncharacterized protein (DUF58 family)